MARGLAWTAEVWEDYLYWQTQDRKTLKRVNSLIMDTLRTPYAGIGKPEALRENLSGLWSRRIDEASSETVDAAHRPEAGLRRGPGTASAQMGLDHPREDMQHGGDRHWVPFQVPAQPLGFEVEPLEGGCLWLCPCPLCGLRP